MSIALYTLRKRECFGVREIFMWSEPVRLSASSEPTL